MHLRQDPLSASDLLPLMNPRSIAVVGASDGPGRGRTVLANLRLAGYNHSLLPVNPKYDRVAGLPCVPDLSALPHPVDLVVFAIPAEGVAPALRRASQGRVRAALVLASGFGESGEEGRSLEEEILSVGRDLGVRICGPNCLGIINVHSGMTAWSASLNQPPRVGGIGVVSQSGTMCIGYLNARADLGFSHIVSVGNEVDVTADEYIRFLVQDTRTKQIALFLEGVRNPKGFAESLDLARATCKPVTILKAGLSRGGQLASQAHTGSLAVEAKVFRGLLDQKRAIHVGDMDEQLAVLSLISQGRPPSGPGVGVVTISGGQCALVCDTAEHIGLELPALSPDARERLTAVLPTFAATTNPLDATGMMIAQPDIYEETLRILINDPGIHLIAVLQDLPAGLGTESKRSYTRICESTVRVAATTDKPIVLFTQFGGGMDAEMVDILRTGNVPLLQGSTPALKAINHWIKYSEKRKWTEDRPTILETQRDEQIVSRLKCGAPVLTEWESKEILGSCGLSVTREALAQTEDEAALHAEAIGFPVVLKAVSPLLPHKSEAGAVRLGLSTPEEVRTAFREILASARRYKPNAAIQGVLVQEQVPPGVEILLGLATDPQFGMTILVGMGGILAEVMEDVSVRPVPITREDAEAMVDSLRGSAVLGGVRGRGPVDREAVVEALLILSQFGRFYGNWVKELDINPFIVGAAGTGGKAADALIILSA